MNLTGITCRSRMGAALAVFVITLSAHAHGAAAAGFVRGDANDDGQITLADVIHVAEYLYGAGPAPLPVPESGDADCDNIVGPKDVVYLINYILRNGPKPKCPTG